MPTDTESVLLMLSGAFVCFRMLSDTNRSSSPPKLRSFSDKRQKQFHQIIELGGTFFKREILSGRSTSRASLQETPTKETLSKRFQETPIASCSPPRQIEYRKAY